MPRSAQPANKGYIEVGYEDKVVFTPREKTKKHPKVVAVWRNSQGLWADHPVFGGKAIEEVIEWLRGEDCDI
jgi:hypothetical protein